MATFIVTSNADGEDGSELTLREAIAAANETEGADVIEFDIGVFSGGEANTIRLSNNLGSLLITDSVEIDASRVAGVTITGDSAGNDITTEDGITQIEETGRADLLDNVRPIAITGDNEETTLRGLTLTGGYVQTPGLEGNVDPGVPGASTNGFSGGGLFADQGSVNFLDGAVSGNAVFVQEGASVASSGGGIFFRAIVNPFAPDDEFDILRVFNTSVEGNHVFGDFSGRGGGINASFLQLENSTVAFNSTEGDSFGFGGGVAVAFDGSLRNATIFGNTTTGDGASGGGVHAQNNLEILNSTIVSNRVEGEGAVGGGVAGFGGSAGTEGLIGGDEKRIANSIILGNVSESDGRTNDVALSPFSPTAGGRDENTFDGVNIIGDLLDLQPTLTTINGPILDRPLTSIFENGGELLDNGGDVFTVKLLDATSNPAIDGSGEGALESDAIGRPAQDFPGRGSDTGLPGVRDIGAHELPFLTGGLEDPDDMEDPEDPADPTDPVDPIDPVDPPIPVGPTSGGDTLTGSAQNDTISALAGDDNVRGLAGDDLIRGGGGADNIRGNGGDDRLRGNGGDDTLRGNGGDDNINGNGGADLIRGNGGGDVINGGGGADDVRGGGGADQITGGGGADQLNGGGGADTLRGNAGDDTLTGNGGADVFQFRTSDRNDTIADFRQGQDRIEILNGAQSFDALDIQQDGQDVLIGFGVAGQIRVVTDNAGAFDESDFIF